MAEGQPSTGQGPSESAISSNERTRSTKADDELSGKPLPVREGMAGCETSSEQGPSDQSKQHLHYHDRRVYSYGPAGNISTGEYHSGNMDTTVDDQHLEKQQQDEKGWTDREKVQEQMQGLMEGDHQTQKTKSVMKNKSPITTSTAIPSRKAMSLVSVQIGKEWKKLGRELGMSDDELHTLRVDHHIEGQEEVVYQMLHKWNTNAYPTTLAQLAQACVNIGRGDIADKLVSLASDPKK